VIDRRTDQYGTATLVIDETHRGPWRSGNGGWTAGRLAAYLPGTAAVTVTLRSPPPLATPLEVRVEPGNASLHHGDELVAEAAPDEVPAAVPAVTAAAARAAEADYPGLVDHPFPSCFVCGTRPPVGEGLRLRPGPIASGRTACTWTPAPGHVELAHQWAALDCPGGWTDDIAGRPMVLGRMTAASVRAPVAGEELVVVGLRLERVGRKVMTATSLYDASGQVVGTAAHTWIRVDPRSFG